MLKAVLITMISFYVLVFSLGVPFALYIFPGGGVAESHLKPIYLGIVFLSGLIVGCTCYINELIKELKSDRKVDE